MDLILVKLGIMADLFGIIGLAGLALLLAAVVWMIISVSNFDSVLLPLLCAIAALALIAGGLALTPMEENEAGEVPEEYNRTEAALPGILDAIEFERV